MDAALTVVIGGQAVSTRRKQDGPASGLRYGSLRVDDAAQRDRAPHPLGQTPDRVVSWGEAGGWSTPVPARRTGSRSPGACLRRSATPTTRRLPRRTHGGYRTFCGRSGGRSARDRLRSALAAERATAIIGPAAPGQPGRAREIHSKPDMTPCGTLATAGQGTGRCPPSGRGGWSRPSATCGR